MKTEFCCHMGLIYIFFPILSLSVELDSSLLGSSLSRRPSMLLTVFIRQGLTSGVGKCGFSGLATIPAASVIEGEALVTCPRDHFGVLDDVLHHHGGLDLKDPPAVGVREEDSPAHGVRGQVVFMGWAVTAK